MSPRRRIAAWLALVVLALGIGCSAAVLAAGPCCCEAMAAAAPRDAAPASVTPCCDADYTLDVAPPAPAPLLSWALLPAPPPVAPAALPAATIAAADLPRADLRALETRVLRL